METSILSMYAQGDGWVSMTLQQLKVFLAVAEVYSIPEAARRLNLRQSTVSFHMKSLGEAVGVPLFEHEHKRRRLTAAGQELLRYAKSLIATVEEAQRVMNDFQRDRKYRLVIGTSHVPATYIVPMVVQRFYERHPQIHLEVECVTSPVVRKRVEDRQVDIGFVIDASPVPPSLQSLLVFEDEIGCVFSPGTGLQWLKTPIAADQLQAIPLIGHAKESSTAQVCEAWAVRHGVQLKSSVTLGSIEMIKTAVKQGMGAALLSKMMVYDEMQRGDLMYAPVEDSPKRQLRLIYQRDPGGERLTEFIEIVREVVTRASMNAK